MKIRFHWTIDIDFRRLQVVMYMLKLEKEFIEQ